MLYCRHKNDRTEERLLKRGKRILAIAGIVLLLAMYGAVLIFALMDSPAAKGLFMGALFCTFAVPVLLYAMGLVSRVLKDRGRAEPGGGERLQEGSAEIGRAHV